MQKKEAKSDEQNLRKLLKGKLDLVVIDKYNASYIFKKSIPMGLVELDYLDPPLQEKGLYLMFSRSVKNYKKIRDDFNRGLSIIKKNGKLEKIINKMEVNR